MRTIDKIVIHCSDSQDSLDIGVKDIRTWHMQQGWSDVGYHYVIRRSGLVEVGRPLEKIGSHVKGYNTNSIGICWVGRNQISPEQMKSLKAIVKGLSHQFELDMTEDVYGHYELDPKKTCPNLSMNHFRAELLFV